MNNQSTPCFQLGMAMEALEAATPTYGVYIPRAE